MIRVGFVLGSAWLGNVNYFRNLLNAIYAIPSRKIEPVLFTGKRFDSRILSGFPPVEVITSSGFDQFTPSWFVRKATLRGFARDPLIQRYLKSHHIDVLSHSDILGANSSIPTLCWIGDFQHVHLPQFFSRSELSYRDRKFRQQCKYATRVLVSSEDAERDLVSFSTDGASKSRVLRFVAQPQSDVAMPSSEELRNRYGFEGQYFHVPNQFWAHKNHEAILDALGLLKQQGRNVQVIATGATEDYRRPDYFKSLMLKSEEMGISDRFKVLGVVPYADLISLMLNSYSLINPSYAEGWSTTVEEAKSLGKRIILSNIPVHLEQAPSDGVYFPPDDAGALAEAMWSVAETFDPEVDQQRRATAYAALPDRIAQFGARYQDIVLEVA